jgi:hypothetical protein
MVEKERRIHSRTVHSHVRLGSVIGEYVNSEDMSRELVLDDDGEEHRTLLGATG